MHILSILLLGLQTSCSSCCYGNQRREEIPAH